MNIREDKEFQQVLKKNLIKAVVSLGIFLLIIFVLGLYFEETIREKAQYFVDSFGLAGMAALAYGMDVILTPISPDVLIYIVSQTHFKENWFPVITFLGCVSTLAGISGWFFGRSLSHIPKIEKAIQPFLKKQQDLVEKYGVGAIVVGALTPIPFSLICWSTGALGVSFKHILIGSLFRLPRYWVYYLIIESSI